MDSHINWKTHISHISKKVSRGTVIFHSNLSIFPYGLIVWDNICITTLSPLIILQKKAVRVIIFSDFREHSSPPFYALGILKLVDLTFFRCGNVYVQFLYSKIAKCQCF